MCIPVSRVTSRQQPHPLMCGPPRGTAAYRAAPPSPITPQWRTEMTVVQSLGAPVPQAHATSPIKAGFWRRAIALIIDWALVSASVSLVFLLLGAAIPGLG